MTGVRFGKLAAIALPFLVLSGLLAIQSLSSVATRSAPEQALALFPVNGLAAEQRAAQLFQQEVENPQEVIQAAAAAKPLALVSVGHDPLAPKSYAILAAAQSDEARRREILDAANLINRRDLTLQGLVLQERLAQGNYTRVLESLDQILRVHTNYSGRFFVVLSEALKVEEAAALFPAILDGQAPWHREFLKFAVRDPDARLGLSRIRPELTVEDEEFDRALILGLAEQGEIAAAQELYASVTDPVRSAAQPAASAWSSQYPPFDWKLTDERGLRAQPSRDGDKLELFARSGEGGIVAQRILAAPASRILVSTTLDYRGAAGTEGVRLAVVCAGDGRVLADTALASGTNSVLVDPGGVPCRQIALALSARALRGEPSLRAELTPIRITAR